MKATLQNTQVENIVFSYSRSLSENEKMDSFLDQSNEQSEKINLFAKKIENLGNFLTEITWLSNVTEKDEIIVSGLLAMGKKADKFFRRLHDKYQKHDESQGLLKAELYQLKQSIDFHYETIKEVEHIMFSLRKDEDFVNLCNLIDEL